jgi:SAM-dependent methyltransferase
VKQNYDRPKIIDVASGNGAVIERALTIFTTEQPEFTCVDVSDAAINNVRERLPQVHGVVADARSIPLDSKSFAVVTSQFGVEYAGLDAVDEIARLVSDGGQIALLMHNLNGSIHKECAANLDAIVQVQESNFIPLCIETFSAGFAAVRGADRAPYDEAAKRLDPAVRALEAIAAEHGEHVADDTIARLYSDVGRIHSEIQHYEPTEVIAWLRRMDDELKAYAGRMESMTAAAIDSESFDKICSGLTGKGFTINRADTLVATNQDLPMAWVLVASR